MKQWKSIVYLLFLLLCLLYIFDYIESSIDQVTKDIRISIYVILTAIILHVLFVILGSFVWTRLLSNLSHVRISLFQGYIHISLVGIGKYLPGKVWGMLARAAHLKRYELSNSQIITATIYEQIMSVHAGMILASILIVVISKSVIASIFLVMMLISLFMNKFFQIIMIRSLLWVMSFVKKNERVSGPLVTMESSSYVMMVVIYMMLWVMSGTIAAILGLLIMGWSDIYNNYIVILLANVVGIVSGFIAFFVPGGIGVRESVSGLILSNSFKLQDALAIFVIYRLWTVFHDLFSAVIIAMYEYKRGTTSEKSQEQ